MNNIEDLDDLFPKNYYESRRRFRDNIADVQVCWLNATLNTRQLDTGKNNDSKGEVSMDWIEAPALANKEQLIILTNGEHGIEGFVGAAMILLFIKEMLPLINPQNTGLLIVHAINPWGMFNLRRTNMHNVDINRNFIGDTNFFGNISSSYNSNYVGIDWFLNPKHLFKGSLDYLWKKITFFLNIIWLILIKSSEVIRSSTLLGQYKYPKGIYYGGTGWEEETKTMLNLYRTHMQQYEKILHIDMHSGYGPRYKMSIVNSYLEKRDSDELIRKFNYPSVVKSNPMEFYKIQGDMIDYLYMWFQNEYPQKEYYGTSFEFGTLGDSVIARLLSLRTMIFENQLKWNGSESASVQNEINRDFLDLYYPQEEQWRKNALNDARQAFKGILNSEGFFDPVENQ